MTTIKYEDVSKRLTGNIMIATKHEVMQYYIDLSEKGVINDLESALHECLPEKFLIGDLNTKYIIYDGVGDSKLTVFKRYSSGSINLGFKDFNGAYEEKPDFHLVLEHAGTIYESVNGFSSLKDLDTWSKEPYNMEFNKVITNIVEQTAIRVGNLPMPTLDSDFYM